ncbi:HlyD family secretion protein [Halomonas denitrificans]|uniref:HlyD family secretion protein n=1 Tax=Halomonas TaxID=2745 RepID=UPI001A8ECD44|nr:MULTISPECIES: HlyD family secretion protein [Halomonas]MED5295710.1 HlyD family secretion protein [Pseudomonadota bacterium]MBN8413515.1 HlyD family secretion protein [Halomonas litopenaei]MBY5926113.1 HlyD family secretion protein [Halomonas sp. DP4Y7-2]MBY5969052.1 HlyD family secretion protein [Halomonas denitrificans]MBY5984673.1 HlyD family secretion protein [Halomonas sp. DP5Y7-2]
MDLLIVLTYAAICIVIFKVFRIPLNKWTVPTAFLGGVIVVSTLVLLMNYNHPFTRQVRQAYAVTPLVSEVRARVTSVNVSPNTLVKAGTPLFTLDARQFEAKVERLTAELEDTLRNSDSRTAGVAEAEANLLAAQADRNQAQRTLARYQAASSAFSRQQIDEAAQVAETTAARVSQAQAALERAQAEQRPDANDQDPLVIAKRAELAQAQYDLENTIIRAPTDGYLTQLAVRPGMMAVPLPLKPMGVFVHDEPGRFTGAFRQQALNRIQQGDEAELTFTALPGQVFSAEVIEVLPAIAESQVAAGDRLLGADAFKTVDAPALVTLRLLPDQDVPDLPLGISAQAAVYTEHFHHVAIMRKVLLRMLGWQHYLYLDH